MQAGLPPEYCRLPGGELGELPAPVAQVGLQSALLAN